jgi:hypothetical protein
MAWERGGGEEPNYKKKPGPLEIMRYSPFLRKKKGER